MTTYAREGSPYGYDSNAMSPPALSPRGKTLVEGYRGDIMTGFEKEHALHNPMNPDRPQSSALVDLKDPIQVHLLTETALSDSKEFEILSQEEVDDLKKQSQSLSQRVESTRQNLTIQSKYRDAAISMARLYNPAKSDGRRRSLLSRNSGDQARARDAEIERQASERKCEELAAELFNLEKRLMEPQRRLLEHTAGILQLTHKASNKKKDATPTLQPLNGMPGSPESLYTYTRNSVDRHGDDIYFNDNDFRDQGNGVSTRAQPRQQPMEIPLKSPIREQNSQLKDEMEKIKDENLHLKGQSNSLVQSITEMEARLENLNGSLRDAIVRFDPSKNEDYYDPPFGVPGMKPGELLNNQMDYLEMGLNAIEAEQESSGENGKVDSSIDKRIESLNQQVRDLLLTVDPDYPVAPDSTQNSIDAKLDYLEDSLRAADSELERAVQAAQAGPPEKQDGEQVERILMNLWNMMQTGFSKIKKEKEERRRARMDRGYEDEEVSDDEFDTDEPFSLPGFSNRVQWLYSQATTLKNQKSVLQRQIKQQRELNNKSDAEKDEELARKQEELDETQVLLARAERDAMTAQTMLTETLEELEGTRSLSNIGSSKGNPEGSTKKIDELEADVKRLQSDLAGAAGAAGAAHARAEESEDRIAILEKDLEQLTSDLADATAAAAAAQSQLQDRENKIDALESELDKLETARGEIEERNKRINTLQAELEQANAIHAQVEERDAKIASLHTELQEASTFRDQVEVHSATIATLKTELEKTNDIEARLEERNARVARLESDMELLQADLAGAAGAAGAAQGQLEERNSKVAALEADIKQLEERLVAAESSSDNTRNQLTGVDSVIDALNAQLDGVNRSREMAEENARSLQQRVDGQKEELLSKKKMLKEKEDELDLLNMNMVEMKTELTIAQAELDGAYGTRAERAADVAAIKTSGEVMKLQNHVTKLKKELAGTVQELEDVTRETLAAEREKIELENKLQDVQSSKRAVEGEVTKLRQRLEADMEKSRQHIAELQEALDGERLKAIPPNGGVGRGASVLSEQFRATMREERKKFQENIREERARTRQLEEELAKLKQNGV
ncbi:myosin-II heavy chain [Fusarium heterosporum]|uniref:Myosin-II heavy chain n=1 Tax=Fusarium heterosporum TaxID=42747 RepID=A0A8H5SR74_FUSHE|nr:myosin-II heavy chain [Fusarium heterosporum]